MAENSVRAGDHLRAAFIAVTTLFFVWGFTTSIIDPLIPSVQKIFNLSTTQSMLTQFAFFMSYGIVSIPGAKLVASAGYSRSILLALTAMVLGCLFVPFATSVHSYNLVLVALFIIGAGITVLQIAANPLAAALGSPERSHFRLTLSQAFNSLGTVIGPYIGSRVMLRGGVFDSASTSTATTANLEASLRNIDTSFLGIAAMIVLLAIFIWRFSKWLQESAPPPAASTHDPVLRALTSPWALLGAMSIFLYVGAEVSIGSVMIRFLHQRDVLDVPLDEAGTLLSRYWFGAMIGRFAGSLLLTRFRATSLLAMAAAVAAALCLTVNQGTGSVAAVCALAIGLFNSIMFPTIFTITLERSTASTSATSGLLCAAIIGGAILPYFVGRIVDWAGADNQSAGLHAGFLVPMAAYIAICVFAMAAAKARVTAVDQPAGTAAH